MPRCTFLPWTRLKAMMATRKHGSSCRQRLWLFCQGAIYFKLIMFAVKVIVIGALLYFGVSDEDSSVHLQNTTSTRTPHSAEWRLEMCPYLDKYQQPEQGLVFRTLINIKWFLLLPLRAVQCAAKMGKNTEPADVVRVYVCSLSRWGHTRIFSTWRRDTGPLDKKVQKTSQLSSNDLPFEDISGVFLPKMSLGELQQLHGLLEVFAAEMYRQHVTFFLYGDSLLDTFHHHGMAPWGDVVNVAVPVSDTSRLKQVLNRNPKYRFVLNSASSEGAFFTSSSKPVPGSDLRWPYIKVSLYGEDMRQVWDLNSKYAFTRRYERTLIFPLQSRPFWNMWLPVPRDTPAILLKAGDVTKCTSSSHNHRTGRWIPNQFVVSLPCSFLYKDMPLVFRQRVKQGTAETLRKDAHTLQTILILNQTSQSIHST